MAADKWQARWLLIAGAVLCVPATIIVVIFAMAAADEQALGSAPWCAVPTRGTASSCVSVFDGAITSVTTYSRSLDRITIDVHGSSVDVGSACFLSPNVCSDIVFKTGTRLTTGWWRGRVVVIGPSGSRPSVITDENPAWQLRQRATWLAFVVACVSVLIAGIVMWQAPTTKPTTRWRAWRIAWGSGIWVFFVYVAWQALFMLGLVFMFRTSQFLMAPVWLACTGLLSFACGAVATALYTPGITRSRASVRVRRKAENAVRHRTR